MVVVVVVFFFCVTILRIWWWYYYVSVLLLLSTCTLPSTVRWVTSPGWPPCSWPGDSFVGSIPDWNTRIWIAPILWLTSQLVYFIIDCWPITCTPCIHFTCVCCYYLLVGGLNCCRVQAARATFIVCIFILGEEREPDDKVRFLAAQKHKIPAQHKIQLQLLQLRPKSQCHDDHYLYCAVHATQSKHHHRTHNTHIYVCTM